MLFAISDAVWLAIIVAVGGTVKEILDIIRARKVAAKVEEVAIRTKRVAVRAKRAAVLVAKVAEKQDQVAVHETRREGKIDNLVGQVEEVRKNTNGLVSHLMDKTDKESHQRGMEDERLRMSGGQPVSDTGQKMSLSKHSISEVSEKTAEKVVEKLDEQKVEGN